MVFSGYIPSSGNAGSYGSSFVVAVQLLSHVQLFVTVWTVVVLCLLFFKKFIFFLLKDNCFTEFWCFLSNLNMNQP